MDKIYNRMRRLLPVATNEQRTNNTPKIETSRFLFLNCFVLVEIWSLSTSLLRRRQAQTLPDASQQIGKNHQFSKIAINLMLFKILNLLKILK